VKIGLQAKVESPFEANLIEQPGSKLQVQDNGLRFSRPVPDQDIPTPARCFGRLDCEARSAPLAQDIPDNLAVDIRQAAANAVMVVGQLLVIEAQQMQGRRMEIVGGHGILSRQAAHIVGRSVGEARL
jgi:hypothetical protein